MERQITFLTGVHLKDRRECLLRLLGEYRKKSGDSTCRPPEEMLNFLEENVKNPDVLILIYGTTEGAPYGFLIARIVYERDEKIAYIASAYLDPEVTERRGIIREAMERFETWAVLKNATSAVFHTARSPEAHRAMVKLGWRHRTTIYEKEMTHGKY